MLNILNVNKFIYILEFLFGRNIGITNIQNASDKKIQKMEICDECALRHF
jgi:hypothetical protein